MTHEATFEELHIRKWYCFQDETLATESGHLADGNPLIRVVIGAAIRNPYAGRFEPDMGAAIKASIALGHEFGRRLQAQLGGRAVESYGKACVVGLSGDYEHGNAFLTTDFANPLRAAIGGGQAWIPSTGKRGGPGTEIDIPFAHKDALYVRSHYDTLSISLPDAPAPDEVLILFAAATRGRLHARLGGIKASEIKGRDGLR
jgi:Amino acid synthesis